MKITLLNLPWVNGNRLGVRAGSRWPFTSEVEPGGRLSYVPFPFFLAYAAALLKEDGNQTMIIDAVADGKNGEQTQSAVKGSAAQLVVAEISTPSVLSDLLMLNELRRAMPEIKIAVCGPHATVMHYSLAQENEFIDYVLRGEYEFVLRGLVRALRWGSDLKGVEGVTFRNRGEIVVNRPVSVSADINAFPWPERAELPLERYNDGFCGLPVPNVQMLSSRGCPFNCVFCLWPQTIYAGSHYRSRDPGDVVDEFAYLVRTYGFRSVYFDDDIFNFRKEHVLAICAKIREMNLRVPWAAMGRADLMDEETLAAMAAAGAYALKYGIESADPLVNESCGKRADIQKELEMVKLTRAHGIKVQLSFCLGLPGENGTTMEKNREFVRSAGADSLQLSFATPFPGTAYFDQLNRQGKLSSFDWSDYDGNLKSVIKGQEMGHLDLERIKSDFLRSCNF